MARRLFSSRITESGSFLKMPPSSQSLYFHLNMHADDDGIVEAYKVMKLTEAKEDDFNVLVSRGFVRVLNQDLVSYIPHWLEHNVIRADRKVDSIYHDLLVQVLPDAEVMKSRPRGDTVQGRLYIEAINGPSSDSPRTVRGQLQDKIRQDKTITPLPPELAFDAFYEKYPKHIARQVAKKSWERIDPSVELAQTIFQRLEVHRKCSQWLRDGGKYIPHPATWLNQRRWEDEVTLSANQTIKIA